MGQFFGLFAFVIISGALVFSAWRIYSRGLQITRQKALTGAPAMVISAAMLAAAFAAPLLAFWLLFDLEEWFDRQGPKAPIDMAPPAAATGAVTKSTREPLAIVIAANGCVMYQGREISADELEQELQAARDDDARAAAVVLVHPQATAKDVQKMVTVLTEHGITNYSLRVAANDAGPSRALQAPE